MTTQLLFGETYTVIEQESDWTKIRCSHDQYTGWIDRKNEHSLTEESFVQINLIPHAVLDGNMVKLTLDNTTCMTLSPGSELPFYDPSVNGLEIDHHQYLLHEKPVFGAEIATVESVMHTAANFLNVPYLWGGRSIFGIDCSGLIQVIFKINHIRLPRDANQQVLSGKPVSEFEDARQGDLAFFRNNEGKITHAGILMTNSRILHASGYVRMDQLDGKGIFNMEKRLYTHQLGCIRRIL